MRDRRLLARLRDRQREAPGSRAGSSTVTEMTKQPPPNASDVWHAANFAIVRCGTVDAITGEHIVAIGSYLGGQGIEGPLLVAQIGNAYDLLLAKQRVQQ